MSTLDRMYKQQEEVERYLRYLNKKIEHIEAEEEMDGYIESMIREANKQKEINCKIMRELFYGE